MVGFVTENNSMYAGKHLLIDFYECGNHGSLEDIQRVMVDACKATGATVLFAHLHPFPGGGVSGAIILAESHLSAHSWPEHNFVALDIFVCGECDPTLALPILEQHFKPQLSKVKLEKRGLLLVPHTV
jgi:S-adenosylmethionine decarboxylase